jgi:N-acetylneuraminate lyase
VGPTQTRTDPRRLQFYLKKQRRPTGQQKSFHKKRLMKTQQLCQSFGGMNFQKLRGLYPAALTGFKADGTLNLEIIEQQLELMVSSGCQGVFIAGTTGESISLSVAERKQLAEEWVRAIEKKNLRGKFKLIVQVGCGGIQDAKSLAAHAESVRADAVASLPPFFFKPSSIDNLVSTMAEIASAAPHTPFYYYHIPSFTGVTYKMLDFLQAADDKIPTLIGMKFSHSDMFDFGACVKYQNERYNMMFGYDEMLITAVALGMDGAVGATFNLPFMVSIYSKIIEAHTAGNESHCVWSQRIEKACESDIR